MGAGFSGGSTAGLWGDREVRGSGDIAWSHHADTEPTASVAVLQDAQALRGCYHTSYRCVTTIHVQVSSRLKYTPLLHTGYTTFTSDTSYDMYHYYNNNYYYYYHCCYLYNYLTSPCLWSYFTASNNNNNNNHFMALCLGLPGWAGTRRNTHPPTMLIIIQSLSASSIYHDP